MVDVAQLSEEAVLLAVVLMSETDEPVIVTPDDVVI